MSKLSLYKAITRGVSEADYAMKTQDDAEGAEERAADMDHWQWIEGNPLTPGEIAHSQEMDQQGLSVEEKIRIIKEETDAGVRR